MTGIQEHEKIKIGTLVDGLGNHPASYIKQILPHGFESFSLIFRRNLGGCNLEQLANEIRDVLGDTGAVISSLSVYGNPLEDAPENLETLRSWETLIDNAHLFGADIVAGFTGRLRDKPIEESIPRFREIFTPLALRAEDQGIRIAFENCAMGGSWQTGDWNIAHNPAAWEKMFDAVPNENLGLQWEPCHQMVNLIDPIPQLCRWAGRIFHIHGKCCTIKWDIIREYGIHGPLQFAYHRTPGFGDCDWSDIISELRWANFEGSIDIEGWHDPIYREELEMTGQVHALRYLKQCRGGDYVQNPT